MFNMKKEIQGAKVIAVSGHIRPDGDCTGSVMGLYLYLKKAADPDCKVMVFLQRPADKFHRIKGMDEIQEKVPADLRPDVFFCLDCSKDRLGDAQALFDRAKKTINIDHHISNANGCADINYIDTAASSASELVYDLLDKADLDQEIAEALYIGIIHDSGVFQYSNTSPKTLGIAADLISYGFDFSTLIEETFYQKTYVQSQILGRALLESFQFLNGRCVVSCIDRKVMEFYNVTSADLDGIVAQLRNIKGAECAIFMYETGVLEYKVSLRSTDRVDVSAIASWFGGGGHKKAAGCTMNGTFYDVVNNLSAQIEQQLEEEV